MCRRRMSRAYYAKACTILAVLFCLTALLHLQMMTSVSRLKKMTSVPFKPLVPLAISEIMQGNDQLRCAKDIKYTREQDLLHREKLDFIKDLKNPCWRDDRRRLHCLPYMFLVGVAKCGTSDLFKRITLHPDFVAPTVKEPGWLSSRRFYGNKILTHYTDTFFSPLRDVLKSTDNQRATKQLITGEASINTLEGAHFWHLYEPNVNKSEPIVNNADYIKHLSPDTRIMINVRNPIDRLWSEYLAFSWDPYKSAEKFHAIVTQEIGVYTTCLQERTLRSCMYDVQLGKLASMNKTERMNYMRCKGRKQQDIVMLKRGVYHVYIRDFLKVFPRDRVLIQRLEDISDNGKESLLKTYSFLGLRNLNGDSLDRILSMTVRNSRLRKDKKVGVMMPETRQLLHEFYRPHNTELATLLGDDKYNYD